MTQNEQIQKVAELTIDTRICMLTTMTFDHKHVSRPMAMQQTEFDGDLWFFTYKGSDKVKEINHTSNVNVSFSNNKSNSWVSLSGDATESYDEEKAKELWNPLYKAWFPDGLKTPGLTLIKVHADSAEYWDSPDSKVVQVLGMAKAAITGKPAKGGENKTVELN